MKILIVNQPLLNRGDEAAHRALIRSLLKSAHDIEIRVLFVDCYSEWSVQQYKIDDPRVKYVFLHVFFKADRIGIPALRKKWREKLWNIHPSTRQIKKQYDWADVVLCAPGGVCMGPFQMWDHLYFLKWAKHCHKPLAYFGRSFGPFPTETKLNRQFKEISYEMLHYFSFLLIRDKVSEQFASEIGVPYISTVDTAFLDDPDVEIPYEIKMSLNGKKYMVFVPNYLLWHPYYEGKFELEDLIDFYCRMVKTIWDYYSDLSIVMLPQTFGNENMRDDIHLFRMIAEKLNDKRVIVVPDCYSSDLQQQIIKDSQFVIGARYHSIVFAINQNVPFIALSYEHKIAGLLATLGIDNSMVDFTNTMLTVAEKDKCIAEIKKLLPVISSNEEVRRKAKQIAKNGLDQFISRFQND